VPVLVDGHVHFHDAYDVDRFFDAALANFAAGARDLGLGSGAPGFLMLTESARDDRFGAWAVGQGGHAWQLEPTAEQRTLLARREDGASLFVVAGCQVQSAEGVELLALATLHRPADGLPIVEVLGQLRGTDAIPVVPWGFGKWWRRRGRLVQQLVQGEHGERLFLADTAGRPRLSLYPPLLRAARERARPVLAGSDPLPFRHDEGRAGSFGFELRLDLDPQAPAAGITAALRSLRGSPRRFGRLERFGAFCRNQVGMQWRKRGPGGRA
jgi:hypothetical protein